MFFDIPLRPSYLQYSSLYNDLLSGKTGFNEFTKKDVPTELEQY